MIVMSRLGGFFDNDVHNDYNIMMHNLGGESKAAHLVYKCSLIVQKGSGCFPDVSGLA